MRTHEEIMQVEKQALKRQLLIICQQRRMSRGEYFERVTRDYELRLEYH